jgi:hypothetical protein
MVCTKCKEDKSDDQFPFKNKIEGKRSTICSKCQCEYKKKYYRKNKQSHYKRNEKSKESLKQFILEEKKKGCQICGEACIPCLEFHHLNKNEKEYDVSRMYFLGSLDKLKLEIEKCVILCANCHRKVHAGLLSLDAGQHTGMHQVSKTSDG